MTHQTYRVFFFDHNDQPQEGIDQIWLRDGVVVKVQTHDVIIDLGNGIKNITHDTWEYECDTSPLD